MFQSTAINVTTEGHKHLGAVIGSQEYQKDYVDGKLAEWVGEIVKLAEIATTEPQACYFAYISLVLSTNGLTFSEQFLTRKTYWNLWKEL